jgi:hypothetical protein
MIAIHPKDGSVRECRPEPLEKLFCSYHLLFCAALPWVFLVLAMVVKIQQITVDENGIALLLLAVFHRHGNGFNVMVRYVQV